MVSMVFDAVGNSRSYTTAFVPGDVGDFRGNREYDVEVSDRQQVSLELRQPRACGGALALGAVPVLRMNEGNQGARLIPNRTKA
jgi:hypothetical protein